MCIKIQSLQRLTPFLCTGGHVNRSGDADVDYCFICHTGVGGVAYAMAVTCLRLQAAAQAVNLAESSSSRSDIATSAAPLPIGGNVITRPMEDEEAFRQSDYRDILSLTRVLANGPASKIEADIIIERYCHLSCLVHCEKLMSTFFRQTQGQGVRV